MSRLFETREGDDGLPGPARRLAVLALITGTLMAVIDTTMINIALPSIGDDLGVTPARTVWVISLFQVVCAACLLLFAAASELLSRRRVYLGGLLLFTLASLGAMLSRSFEALLVCRALQGVGAAATLSIGPSLYRLIFPTRLLGAAMGLSALVVAGGYASGPTLGGLVLAVADWPWLFALNLPLGLAALALAWWALPREPRRSGGFDAIGALLSAIMLASFFLAMDALGHGAPRVRVAGLVAVSLVAGGLFLRRQRRASHPLLPLALFRERRFSLALVVSGLSFIAQGLAFVALSFLYQREMGRTPLETAWLFTPWPLTIMVAAPLAGRVADRFNPALLSTLGLALLLAGLVSLALLDAEAGVVDGLWRTALCGLGFGLFQAPNNREMMSSVPLQRSANASGMMSTTRTIGQSLGVALVGVVLGAGAASVQGALWAGVAACALAILVSLRRVPLAAAARAAGQGGGAGRIAGAGLGAYNGTTTFISARPSVMSIQARIEDKLKALDPSFLEVENESHRHSVPPNSETHFKVTLVSASFAGLMPVKRHQQIYATLADELAGPVHALALHLYTPDEWQARGADRPDSPDCRGGGRS